jgi:molecular chaperone Hsp33
MMSGTHATSLGDFGHAMDDAVVPFEVSGLDLRGRIVQLGPMVDAIISRHAYPDPVARTLAEAIVLVALVGSSLKFDGKITLQSQSDGPVNLIVADFVVPGNVRAYARFDPETDWSAIEARWTDSSVVTGHGMLAFTVDQGPDMNRYQGVVPLEGASLQGAAMTYFKQSEQIPTDIRVSVARLFQAGEPKPLWRAGGALVQFLPQSQDRVRMTDLPDGRNEQHEVDVDDAWREASVLMQTIADDELTDPQVGAERLLFRLFHEHGVRVQEAMAVADQCACSRERIGGVLTGLPPQDLADSFDDEGKIEIVCEFCSTKYHFTADQL